MGEHADVIVVGAGNAALVAALSAHEQGAKVVVLEAAPSPSAALAGFGLAGITVDWLFVHLQPPLVALDITPGRGAFVPYFTLGGLDTRTTGEVLTTQGEVIPGLYAAGRTACGVVRRAEGYSSGMSVGDATFSGRMAGRQAAEAPRR